MLIGAASNNIKVTSGNGPPASGKWQRGDRVLNNDPRPGDPAKGHAGWICTESSSAARPIGVWNRFGVIEPTPTG
jgi:hypothetical protein